MSSSNGYVDASVDEDAVGYYLQKDESKPKIEGYASVGDDNSDYASGYALIEDGEAGAPSSYTENATGYELQTTGYTDNSVTNDLGTTGYSVNSPSGYTENSGDSLSAYSENEVTSTDSSPETKAHPQPAVQPPQAAPPRGWNEEFQILMTEWSNKMAACQGGEEDAKKLLKTAEALGALVKDFTDSALEIGRKIISELHLAEYKRTIKPVNAGGIAGGEKYIEGGIFFKLAVDLHRLYGGDRYAAKAASRELLGLMHLLNQALFYGVVGPHFPLMCIISYRGFTVVASSCLPLGKDTLVYGSNDGGKTVAHSDPEVNALVERLMRPLNLKEHVVGKTEQVSIFGPADLEVHRGKDGRVYVLDTARVFPPHVPDRAKKGGFLYRLMRPELVSTHPTPLSSDAFSGFGLHEAATHNEEVRDADRRLLEEVVPDCAHRLEAHWKATGATRFTNDVAQRLIIELKLSGVNVEFLGLLRQSLKDEASSQARKFLMNEIVARTLKNILIDTMRDVNASETSIVHGVIAFSMNRFFRDTIAADFWDVSVRKQIDRDFTGSLLPAEANGSVDLRTLIDIWPVYQRLTNLAQVEISMTQEQFESGALFDEKHIVEFNVKMKRMYIFDYVKGYALTELAQATQGDLAETNFVAAETAYGNCVSRYPADWHSFAHHGITLLRLGELSHRSGRTSQALEYFSKADEEFAIAARLNPRGAPNIYKNWGICLKQTAAAYSSEPKTRAAYLDRAVETLRKAVELDSNDFMSLENLGLTFSNKGYFLEGLPVEDIDAIFAESQKWFTASAALKPNLISPFLNSAIAYYYQAIRHNEFNSGRSDDYFAKAGEQFEKASKAEESKVSGIDLLYSAYFNWGMGLYMQSTHKLDALQRSQESEHQALVDKAYDLLTQAQGKLALSVKYNPEFHLSYHYWALVLDKLASVFQFRNSPALEVRNSLESAVDKIDKALVVFKNYTPAMNSGRDIAKRLSQLVSDPAEAMQWLAKAADFGTRAVEIAPAFDKSIYLGGVYIDMALRSNSEEQQLKYLDLAEPSYLKGLQQFVQSSRLTLPADVLPLLETKSGIPTNVWEFLAYDDEVVHTQTLDILQRLTVHEHTQRRLNKCIKLLNHHKILSHPKSPRVLRFAVMFVANLAALSSNRPLLANAAEHSIIQGLTSAIQSRDKEVQNVAMRALANLCQDPQLRSILAEVSAPNATHTLPQVMASQIAVSGAPERTSFFMAVALAGLLQEPSAAKQFLASQGMNCILDLLDTRSRGVVVQVVNALDNICSKKAPAETREQFKQQVAGNLLSPTLLPADEEWYIWMLNEILLSNFEAAELIGSGFVKSCANALSIAKGVTCKYALNAAQKFVRAAIDGDSLTADALKVHNILKIIQDEIRPCEGLPEAMVQQCDQIIAIAKASDNTEWVAACFA